MKRSLKEFETKLDIGITHLISMSARHNRIIDYFLLFIMVLPNLIWILLDRGISTGDIGAHALQSMKLYDTFINDSSHWWNEMLSITPKPPMVMWLGHLFIPIGKFLGHVDSGLLMPMIITQYVALVFLYKALLEFFERRSIAIVGCIIVASAPFYVSFVKQLWMQPLQIMAVTWSVYIMAYSKKWENITIILQLIAASSFALLIMMSSLLYCFIPGIFACIQIKKNGWANIGSWKKHIVLILFALLLVFLLMSWYLKNFATALEYARFGSQYAYNAVVEGFFRKILYWNHAMLSSFFFPYILILIFPIFVLACYDFLKKRKFFNSDRVIFVAVVQIVFPAIILATVNTQDIKYMLPLLVYFAIIICWSLWQLNKKWLMVTTFLLFLSQFVVVNLNDFGVINMKRNYYSFRSLKRDSGRLGEIMISIIKTTSDEPFKKVLFATIGLYDYGLGFGAFDLYFYALKHSEYFSHDYQEFHSVEFLLDHSLTVEEVWKQIISSDVGYIILINEKVCPYLQDNGPILGKNSIQIILNGAKEFSDKIRKNKSFKKVFLPKDYEIEIYKYIG